MKRTLDDMTDPAERDAEITRLCAFLSHGKHYEMAIRASYGLSDAERNAVHDHWRSMQNIRRMRAMFSGVA